MVAADPLPDQLPFPAQLGEIREEITLPSFSVDLENAVAKHAVGDREPSDAFENDVGENLLVDVWSSLAEPVAVIPCLGPAFSAEV